MGEGSAPGSSSVIGLWASSCITALFPHAPAEVSIVKDFEFMYTEMSPIPAPPFLGLPKLLSTFLEQEACKAVERAKICPVRKCSVRTDFHVNHRSHARVPALQSPANHR